MDGSSPTFSADRLDHGRVAGAHREKRILRSMADRGVIITPERPVVHVVAGAGVWFRSLFARPRPLRFA